MEDTVFYISTVYKLSGQSITEELVREMGEYYGKSSSKFKIATSALESLKPKVSLPDVFSNAQVSIPNSRSSTTTRTRGRSVD